jgi:hypothetical protein
MRHADVTHDEKEYQILFVGEALIDFPTATLAAPYTI